MPPINSRLSICGGVGSGPVSVDNKPIATGGAACWLDDDTVIFNGPNAAGAWVLRTYHVPTGLFADLNPAGANFLAAGGGRYAAQAGTCYANFAFASGSRVGLTITDGRAPASPDGAIALCPDASCTSFDVYRPDGSVEHQPYTAYNLQIVAPGVAVWDGGSVGIAIAVPVPCERLRVVRLLDADWIVAYANGVGLIAFPNGSGDGYVLTAGPAYYHDARGIGNELYVSWSTTQGEGPGSNTIVHVDRSQPRVPLAPPPPVLTYPTYAFDHPVILAPFYAAGSGDPDVLSAFGQYSEAVDPIIPPPTVRLILGHDALSDWTLPPGLRSFDVPILEWYRDPSETLDQSVARWTRQTQALLAKWPGTIGGIPMFYTQQRWTAQQVFDGLQQISAIVNRSPRLVLIAPFAYQRANGITGVPDFQRSFADLQAACTAAGLGTLPPIPTPIPPKPPVLEGDLMAYFTTVDPTKVIVAYGTKPSSQPGCVNVLVDAAGTVFSAHGDTRPPGTDGAWEQGQLTGTGLVTFWADGKAWPYGIVYTDKLQK